MTDLLPPDVDYDEAITALLASENALLRTAERHISGPVTYASLYGMGLVRRAVGLSMGFRTMVEQKNSVCAMPIVRMQLNTVLRLYAGFLVDDHQKFCLEIFKGQQIDRMKSSEGDKMRDRYLLERVAERNPWMTEVYKMSSGHIHYSARHVQEVVRVDDAGRPHLVVSPVDIDRQTSDFREPIRCMHHLHLILDVALEDWFSRLCRSERPDDIVGVAGQSRSGTMPSA
jgi:hypothetical protein